eukprot:6179548-Pleurochrysis_carterae.AAC.3
MERRSACAAEQRACIVARTRDTHSNGIATSRVSAGDDGGLDTCGCRKALSHRGRRRLEYTGSKTGQRVYVARPGDTARTINTGIQGMRALLITPAVYDLNGTVVITESNFVVLGLGIATLVSRNGHSALQVSENAAGVRVAGVLFESGSALKADAISSPL